MTKKSAFLIFSFLLILLGVLDTLYLTWEHYANIVPPCPTHPLLGTFVDCGRVLRSQYSSIFGVPLAVLGLGYYLFLLAVNFIKPKLLIFITPVALLASIYFLYLQIFVLHAICIYCTFSGLINLLLFGTVLIIINLNGHLSRSGRSRATSKG